MFGSLQSTLGDRQDGCRQMDSRQALLGSTADMGLLAPSPGPDRSFVEIRLWQPSFT
jgi:hypothetical protein